MLLSDNETKLDMLNNRAIAKTVVSLIKDSKKAPISIGIHGDWGAGKSSVLKMIEEEIGKDNSDGVHIKCIWFNGWRYQGLEDSKSALMGAIITELEKDETIVVKAKDIFKKLWKNINWISTAKNAGKIALSVASGTAPLAIINSVFDVLKSGVSDNDKIASSIDTIGGFLKEAKVFEDTSSNKEFSEFQKNFDELLSRTNITKLVVLIDDLDRCLPNVAIEVLEAMRLFMFNEKTAFIIAADEIMIKYSVKKHFPEIVHEVDQKEIPTDYGFSDKYLEKLIQVPFRIPRLGILEAKLYIMMLLVGSRIDDNTAEYRKLVDEAIAKLKTPWKVEDFTIIELQNILGDKFDEVKTEIEIAMHIRDVLAANTSGNPRKIKRFVNMLLLRFTIAKERGFDESFKIGILAKMMLAEYYFGAFYRDMALHLNAEGKCIEMGHYILSHQGDSSQDKVNEEKSDKVPTIDEKTKGDKEYTRKNNPKTTSVNKDDDWFEKGAPIEWVLMKPDLSNEDLRPYYFASKENEDFFFDKTVDDKIREIVLTLMAQSMAIASRIDDIKALSADEADKVYDLVIEKIFAQDSWDKKPNGIDGLVALVENHQRLRGKLLIFIKGVDVSRAGIWIVNGWNKALPKDSVEGQQLKQYFDSLSEKEGVNTRIKQALKV